MTKTAYIMRNVPAGTPASGQTVTVKLPDDTTVDTLTTDADGIAHLELDGSPGPLIASGTVGGRTIYRDGRSLDQLGTWFPNDAPRLWRTLGNGVIAGYTDPEIEADDMAVGPGTGLQVTVGEGVCVIDGHVYACTADTNLAIDANASGSTRVDRVVVRFTREGESLEGKCVLTILKGTPGAGAPALTKTDATFEFSLGAVTVINGASSFVSDDIADERYSPTLNQAYVYANPNAFDNASTSLRAGDILYVNNSGKLTRLAKGTDGQTLGLSSGLPAWGTQNVTVAGITDLTATASEINVLDGITATTAELNYTDGVTSNLQAQIDGKAATSHTHNASDISAGVLGIGRIPTGSSGTTVALGNHTHTADSILPSQSGQSGKVLKTNGTTASWQSESGGGGGGTVAWGGLTGSISNQTDLQAALDAKAASSHTHDASAISSGTLGIARIPTGTTSSTVSLGNHTHSASAITSGTLDISRLPTGTGGSEVALGNHTHSNYASSTHGHTAYQNFGVRASRNAVTSAGVTVTSESSQDILSDTQVLSSGVTYDLMVTGHAQLSANSGSVEVAIEVLDGSSNELWSKVWLGTQTANGERGVLVYAEANNISGGQTITVKLVARKSGGNATIGTASFAGQFIARGVGSVS